MKQEATKTDMDHFQKIGGIAALIAAATFLVAMAIMIAIIAPAGYGSLDLGAIQNAAFLADNQAIMYLWNLIGYVIFGVVLVILSLALYERLQGGSPAMVRTATAFGLIWAGLMFASGMVANIGAGIVVDVFAQDPAQAGPVWLARQFVVDGLGGGNEIVGGLWVLLLSWAALRTDGLPKALSIFGLLVGAAGLVTIVPALGEVGAIFGLGSIAWFIWVGILLVRSKSSRAVEKADAFAAQHGTAS